MSEAGEKPVEKPESTLIQQDGAIPETVIPVEETPETPPETEAKPEVVAETVAEPEKPKRTPWYQTRIDEITKARRDAERERDELRASLALAKPKEGEEAPAGPDAAALDKLIDQRAEARVAQRDYDRRSKAWIEAGQKEFGANEFNDKCNEVAALGAGESSAFMQLITDPEIIQDGHKVVAALAANPEEATRILALDPLRMSAALTKFASTAKPPEKKISQAPPPIKPIGGSAKPSEPNDDQNTKDWMANRNKTARTSAGGVRLR